MTLNKAGEDLIKSFEGLRLSAYKCSANKDTIGYGNTFYEDGTLVKPGDKITKDRADVLFDLVVNSFSNKVLLLIRSSINENQFAALVSFAYNVGVGNIQKSTLLKKVNKNPSDISIREEFMKWDKAAGKKLSGLTRRRKAEADLYFKPTL